MTAKEMVKILKSFMDNCPESYKMYYCCHKWSK